MSVPAKPWRRVILWWCHLAVGSNKYQTLVGISDVELSHCILPVKQIPDSVAVLERFYMLPQGMNAGDLDVYLGMSSHTLHDLFGCGLHEVNGLAIACHDRILWRFHGWGKPKHVLVKRNGFVHVGHRQHRAYPLRYSWSTHCFIDPPDWHATLARLLSRSTP